MHPKFAERGLTENLHHARRTVGTVVSIFSFFSLRRDKNRHRETQRGGVEVGPVKRLRRRAAVGRVTQQRRPEAFARHSELVRFPGYGFHDEKTKRLAVDCDAARDELGARGRGCRFFLFSSSAVIFLVAFFIFLFRLLPHQFPRPPARLCHPPTHRAHLLARFFRGKSDVVFVRFPCAKRFAKRLGGFFRFREDANAASHLIETMHGVQLALVVGALKLASLLKRPHHREQPWCWFGRQTAVHARQVVGVEGQTARLVNCDQIVVLVNHDGRSGWWRT
mmetsp:Transcript_5227/g.17469  ORF Transcript_5227/g.17469 Transcript_5227/m.17469 type:complete len:279 (+) Transcript_5227:214-1050(+)